MTALCFVHPKKQMCCVIYSMHTKIILKVLKRSWQKLQAQDQAWCMTTWTPYILRCSSVNMHSPCDIQWWLICPRSWRDAVICGDSYSHSLRQWLMLAFDRSMLHCRQQVCSIISIAPLQKTLLRFLKYGTTLRQFKEFERKFFIYSLTNATTAFVINWPLN